MAVGTDQALKKPAVLLLGASSQIGIFAIPRLMRAGFQVFAVSRKGKPEGYPAFEQVDWLNETDALQATQSCQYLLSAGPLELAKKFLTTNKNQFTPNTAPATPDTAPYPGPNPRHPGLNPRHPGPNPRHPGLDPRYPGLDPRHPGLDPRHPGLDPGSILKPQVQKEQNGFRVKPGKTPLSPVPPDLSPVPPDLSPVSPDTGSGPAQALTRGPFQSAVIFSSSSVDTKQKSNNPAERSQIQNMLSLESDLQRTAEDRGIKLVIFRPTLIYGCGLDTNISRLASWIRRYGFMPVNGKAAGLRQPVHADDLASVAITAMLSQEALLQVMFLTGGDTLSYSDMVKNIFTALEKPTRLIRLPEWLFVSLARFAGTSKIGQGINIEMVKRQRLDLVFDDRKARELLNYNPRPFAPIKEDFSLPKF